MSLYFKPVVPRSADAAWQRAEAGMQHPQPKKLVVVSTPLEPDSPEMLTLKNIISACKVSNSDYEIIQAPKEDLMPWFAIHQIYKPSVMLLFGLNAADLSVAAHIPQQTVVTFQEAKWICTLPLTELNLRKEVRQSLWTDALKPIFVPA